MYFPKCYVIFGAQGTEVNNYKFTIYRVIEIGCFLKPLMVLCFVSLSHSVKPQLVVHKVHLGREEPSTQIEQ